MLCLYSIRRGGSELELVVGEDDKSNWPSPAKFYAKGRTPRGCLELNSQDLCVAMMAFLPSDHTFVFTLCAQLGLRYGTVGLCLKYYESLVPHLPLLATPKYDAISRLRRSAVLFMAPGATDALPVDVVRTVGRFIIDMIFDTFWFGEKASYRKMLLTSSRGSVRYPW